MRGESHADTSGTRAMLPANTKKQAKVASRPQSTAAKARPVEGGERGGYDGDGGGDGHDAEYGQQSEGDKRSVDCQAPSAERHRRGETARIVSVTAAVRLTAQPPGASDDAGGRQREGQCHSGQEIAEAEPVIGIEVEVLRVAEGNDHAAEVRSQALQHEHGSHETGEVRAHKGGRRKRQHHDEGHVVGCHARERGRREHEGQREGPRPAKPCDDGAGRPVEGAHESHRARDGQHAEQTAERLPIEVSQIGLVGRYRQGGSRSRHRRHDEHGVLA